MLGGFGQVVIGPPGSGKTTYCHAMSETLKTLGRNVAIVNLDPANETMQYTPDIDISELVTLQDVMEEFDLGPNGGLIYCMEYLEQHMEWLLEKLEKLHGHYFIIDLPGQVEIFSHHTSLKNIIDKLVKANFRLCAVHLVDAHHCTDPGKYISVLLLALKAMIQLELPHINVLSKIDLIEAYGKLAFNLDFYTEVQDLSYLLEHLNTSSSTARYASLNKALIDLVEEFNLVSFYPLCVDDKETLIKIVRVVDKANGYAFGGLEGANESIFQTASRVGEFENVMDVAEKYLKKSTS